MTRVMRLAPAVLLAAAGACVASKGDIRLLQDELRASRSMNAQADTAAGRRTEQLRAQIDYFMRSTNDAMARLTDSLRVVSNRLAAFQATTSGELDLLHTQVVQMQALVGQTTKNMQDMRMQWDALREQSRTPSAPPAGGTAAPDTARPGLPGPATMFNTASNQMRGGQTQSARRIFEQLISAYPTFEAVPLAQEYVGESYDVEGNTTAADSVYQLVYTKYPKSPSAATALFKRASLLFAAGRKQDAKDLARRVMKDYPSSPEFDSAERLLRRP